MKDIPQEPAAANSLPFSEPDVIFARRVSALRKTSGLTQRQLAEQMTARGYRMHQTTVAKVEAGERPVYVGEACAFARVLGVDLVDMLNEPLEPDVAEAVAEFHRWEQRHNELAIAAEHARASLASIEEELAEAKRMTIAAEERGMDLYLARKGLKA